MNLLTLFFDRIIDILITPILFIIIIGFVFGRMIPTCWIYCERVWLRLRLGGSTATWLIMKYAEEDYNLLIKQKEIDEGSLRSLAVVQALLIRIKEYIFHGLTGDYRSMKNEKIHHIYKTAIKNLNEGWRLGLAPTILREYMKIIEDSAKDETISPEEKIRGRGAVSVVKYALGDILKGNELGAKNWEYAKKIENKKKVEGECKDESELRWTASYGYFNSTIFLGYFEEAIRLMGVHWSNHYAELDPEHQNRLKESLGNRLILNPILSIPRHIILAAAFNEKPLYEENCFPNKDAFEEYKESAKDDIMSEILWVEFWYKEALKICETKFDEKGLSRNFSHAYYGFYLTLLFLDPKTPKDLNLCEKIITAFGKIKEDAPIPSLYVKHGFSGVYHLIHGRNDEALNSLREAAQFSDISGNSFADCLFMCCHALAAARLNKQDRLLDPEIKEYLKKSRKLSKRINGQFYPRLTDITYAAVRSIEGKEIEAFAYRIKGLRGSVGKRIQSIFKQDD